MKRYKRYKEMDDKIINCKVGSKIYEVNIQQNEQEYFHLFGRDLRQIHKIFGKQLKLTGGPDKVSYWYSGKLDITIEGLLATAYNLTSDKIFKNLNELINTIFGKTEGAFDYWVDLPEGVEDINDVDIIVDFTYLYNQTLDIEIVIKEN